MKICIPVPAKTTSSALKKMKEIYKKADIMELRIDGIQNVDLPRLLASKKKEVIVTNRRAAEGGAFAGTESDRIELLKQAVRYGADYVDIEARTDAKLMIELFAEIRKQGRFSRPIISWHDFSGTPDTGELHNILRKCARVGEGIIKVAAMANEAEDNLRVLGLIPEAKKMGREIIAFCMGQKGRLSRIAAPVLGSYLSYVSLDKGEESAPGQLTAAEMNRIFRVLADD